MKLNMAALIVPLGIMLILLESILANINKKDVYKFENIMSNLTIGLADRFLYVFIAGFYYFVFDFVHSNWAPWNLGNGFLAWLSILIIIDFLWYWYHRFGHEINIFWAAHVVHHQSEDFNFSVAARITTLQAIVRLFFYAVLSLLGFPADLVIIAILIQGGYSFFTHTRVIGKLGILEKILITPSHHRVHHATNQQYIDKNYGNMFVIWDKLFGTFAEEVEQPEYGISKPLQTNSFLWQHFHFFAELFEAIRQVPSWGRKLKILFGSPELVPPEMRYHAEHRLIIPHKIPKAPQSIKIYAILHLILLGIYVFLFVLFYHYLSNDQIYFTVAFIFISLIICGEIMNQSKILLLLETTRLMLIFSATIYYTPGPIVFGSILMFLLTLFFFKSKISKAYKQLILQEAG